MKKILFLITALNGGGAEKILLETVKAIDNKEYKVTVMSIFNEGIYVEEIKKLCDYKFIFKHNFHGNLINKVYHSVILRLLKYLSPRFQYKLFVKEKYDVEIAYLEGPPTKIISGSTSDLQKFAWIHANPIAQPYSTAAFRSYKEEIKCYSMFDKVIAVSTKIKEGAKEKFNLKEEKLDVKFNILDEKRIIESSLKETNTNYEDNDFNMVAVGRLSPEKNYRRLLHVCNMLKDDNIKFHLSILGEGQELQLLKSYVQNNDLDKYVEFKGFISNPYPYIKDADLLVCSSDSEGFSTVVSESLILNTPVVTTDCAGMQDILGNSEYGLIVDIDDSALYKGVKEMILNKELYSKYKEEASKRAEFFKVETRLKELNELFELH